jgi:hypothetical protein
MDHARRQDDRERLISQTDIDGIEAGRGTGVEIVELDTIENPLPVRGCRPLGGKTLQSTGVTGFFELYAIFLLRI